MCCCMLRGRLNILIKTPAWCQADRGSSLQNENDDGPHFPGWLGDNLCRVLCPGLAGDKTREPRVWPTCEAFRSSNLIWWPLKDEGNPTNRPDVQAPLHCWAVSCLPQDPLKVKVSTETPVIMASKSPIPLVTHHKICLHLGERSNPSYPCRGPQRNRP